MSKNQSPYMLEAAGNYVRAAQILWQHPNMSKVATVNAAIGIEIMLKSFIATPVENDRKGTVSQQYKINGRTHGLFDLYELIDSNLARKLLLNKHEEWFRKYNMEFIGSRYPYEATSSIGYSKTLIDVSLQIFRAMIEWYKETDNPDPWVIEYPNVSGGDL